MGRVLGLGRGSEDHVGALEGARATLRSGSKVAAPAGADFFLFGSPRLLPDNLIEVPRGRRGRGGEQLEATSQRCARGGGLAPREAAARARPGIWDGRVRVSGVRFCGALRAWGEGVGAGVWL